MLWALPYHPIVYLLAATGLFCCLHLARRAAVSPALRSLWFFVPRIVVMGLVFMVLLNPVSESATQLPPTRPIVSCLIDNSRSMGLDRPTSRLEMAKEIVHEAQFELDRTEGAQLQLYSFGTRFSSVPSLAKLTADQDETKLAESLSTAATSRNT